MSTDPSYGKVVTVVPREHRPMVSVAFSAHKAIPLGPKGEIRPNIVVIKLRSRRAYKVVTEEDAQWMGQVIDQLLRLRSSPSAPATDASGVVSSTSTAAASAKRRRPTRPS